MRHLEELPIDILKSIDALCSHWERELRAGRRPTLDGQAGAIPAEFHAILFRELLEIERASPNRPVTRPEPPTGRPAVATEEPIGLEADAAMRAALESSGFTIEGLIGEGGMGLAYRAMQRSLGRRVCVKVMRTGSRRREEAAARFRQEAELMARARHPSIVQVFDIGRTDADVFIAMEYVEGGNLADAIAATPQAGKSAARIVAMLADAVDAAHRAGIVHRDLKPGNVLLENAEPADDTLEPMAGARPPAQPDLDACTPKITDFGLAKTMAGNAELTLSGTIVGTPGYMAPEQADTGGQPVGPAVDIYALGAILYEMLTGRPPFRGRNVAETVRMVIGQDPVPVRRIVPSVPRDLETIAHKCLSKSPRSRYPTAAELRDDLNRFREGRPIRARRASLFEKLARWAGRSPLAAASSLAAASVTVAALGAWVFFTLELEKANVVARDRLAMARLSAQRFYLMARNDPQLQAAGLDRLRNRLEQESLELTERLRAGASDDLQLMRDLANAYVSVGQSGYRLDGHERGLFAFRKGLEIADEILRVEPADQVATGIKLAGANGLGLILAQQGKADEAIAALRAGIDAQQRLMASLSQQDRQFPSFQLARVWMNLGKILSDAGRKSEAVAAAGESLRRIQTLIDGFVEEGGLLPGDYLDTRARNQVILAVSATGEKATDTARTEFRKAMDDFDRIERQGKIRGFGQFPAYLNDSAWAALEFARFEAVTGDPQAAMALLRRARQDAARAVELSPDNWPYRRRLADVEAETARQALRAGDAASAVAAWKAAVESRQQLVNRLPSDWIIAREFVETALEATQSGPDGSVVPPNALRSVTEPFLDSYHEAAAAALLDRIEAVDRARPLRTGSR